MQRQRQRKYLPMARSFVFSIGRFSVLIAAALASLSMSDAAISGDQPLRATLVLRVAQAGFAGVTGTEYRLQPNGQWQALQFVNDRTTGVVGEGQLPPEKMIALSHRLTQTDFARLPADVSATQGVNPAIVEMQYGDDTAAAYLPPGYSLDEPCPDSEDASLCEFLDLAHRIRSTFATN